MIQTRSSFNHSARFSMIRALHPLGLAIAALSISTAMGQQAAPITYAGSEQPPLMDRQKEIALALSACPPLVSKKAAVYVLGESGYVKVRDSDNGFTAIVEHTLPNSVGPQCMNAEATRTHLLPILKLAELRAQRKSAEEIKRIMAEGFASGAFPQPTGKLSVDYMLSPKNLVPNFTGGVAPYPPHVMFFVPGMTNADLGADVTVGPDGNPKAGAFVVNEGTPQAIVIVPVEVHGGSANASNHNHSGTQ